MFNTFRSSKWRCIVSSSILVIAILVPVFILCTLSQKQQQNVTDNNVCSLPAMKITALNMLFSATQDNSKNKTLVADYLRNTGVKGDIESNLIIYNMTTKEIWDNLKVQIIAFKLEYAWTYSTVIVKDNAILGRIWGIEPYIADLDGDCFYEVYSERSVGSGMVSNEIDGYNIKTNTNYHLGNRAIQDFYLIIENDKLKVKVMPWNKSNPNILGEIKTPILKNGDNGKVLGLE
jgi:hypothetical protein